MTILPEQCRAARALLNWSQTKLSEQASVSRATLAGFEGDKRTPISNNLEAIRSTLEKAGVVFIPENGGGAGVRLVKP
ncbi:MAG: helix-turn-helix transcriptional regulator [Rhodobacteraceae bacterium]|nr:helix-turn-helix transcriptional regulator [Paracoccaceae bacterium]